MNLEIIIILVIVVIAFVGVILSDFWDEDDEG